MKAKLPKSIFRYRSVTAETIELICEDKIYYADPTKYNDPFDCKPAIEFDTNLQDMRVLLSKLIERRVSNEIMFQLSNSEIKGKNAESYARKTASQKAEAELANIAYYAKDPDLGSNPEDSEIFLLTQKIQSEILKKYDRGLCCFSSTVIDPVLWSHYGDEHKGICLGYGFSRKPEPNIQKIEYNRTRKIPTSLVQEALVENNIQSRNLLDSRVYFRKANSWKYEKEWRIIGNKGLQNSPLELKDVTFGLRCPNAIVYAIVSSLEARPNKIDFYEIYNTTGSFNLKRRKVDVDELKRIYPAVAQSTEEILEGLPDLPE
ncbi:MAG: DUF2971 domain-containing protein [Candidatus Electrothrix sp. YB6]